MNKKRFQKILSAALAVCMLLSLCQISFAQNEEEPAADTETADAAQEQLLSSLEKLEEEADDSGLEYEGYIFKLQDGAELPMGTLEESDDSTIEAVAFTEDTYTAETTDEIFNNIEADQVEYIEPNYIVEAFDMGTMSAASPNDQYYQNGSQWNLETLNVPSAWEYGLEGQSISDDQSVVVAVIDSGINSSHQDLDETHILEGYSYVTTDTSDTSDTLGHGTFCAAQIFATKDNEVGIAGIVPEVYIMPLRVFGSSNQAYTTDIVSAINYATASGEVDVISMSLGGEGSSTAMKRACESAVEQGILVVAAAGNDGDYTINYPASYDCVIGVGSTGTDSSHTEISDFSQRGLTNVFCVAPGYKIVSAYYTSNDAYYRGSGTSFACPEVAALGAVVKSIDRDTNQDAFKQLIIDTATDLGTAGRDKIYGYGLVDFKAAVESLINTSGNSGVSFVVENEDGAKVENAAITVTKYGETEVIAPNEDGRYTLEKGKYSYTVTADRYQQAKGVFSVITDSRTVKIVLEGLSYPVEFTVTNTRGESLSKAAITVKNAKGAEMKAQESGKYALKNGEYTYSISGTGYYTQTGSFRVNEAGTKLEVTLYGDIDVASAKMNPVDANGESVSGVTVEVRNADGGVVEPYTDGYYKFYPGKYTYTATSNSYKTEKGSFTITEEQKGTIQILDVPMLNPIVWVYFEVVPLDATVTVWDAEGNVVEPEAAGEYKLLKGNYTYEVSADGYETKRDSFTITTKGMTIDTELVSKEDDGYATVAFITSGGSAVEAQRVALGEKLSMPKEPVRSGYTFAGWYQEASLTTPWSFEKDLVTSSMSLYAKWEPRTYKIIYMFGSTPLEGLKPDTHTFGKAVKELPEPTIPGQRFMYWCLDPELTQKATGVSAAKASDAVFYAYCEPDNGVYTVKFDSNGGSDVAEATVSQETNYLVTEPETPEKTGYTFSGWYSDAELTKAWDFKTDKVDWHTTLYAGWKANTYTITYYNGETRCEDLSPNSYTYNKAIYDLPTLKRNDAVFSGWYSDAACTVRVRSIPAGSLGDLVLYAGWSEKKTTVPEDCDYKPDEDGNYPTVDAEGYTLIYTQEQLAALPTCTSAEARALKQEGTVRKYRLAQSIRLSGEWTPIGSGSKFFYGELDGAGHTIAGLYINSGSSRQALFSGTYGAKVHNLNLYGQVQGGATTAGLVAEAYDTEIANCTVDVDVVAGGTVAGGVAASLNSGSITNCANLGSITCNGTITTKCVYGTGGILGETALFSTNAVIISDCYNSGAVSNSSGTPTGGIVGYTYNNKAQVLNCYNTGDVTQTGTDYAYYGIASGIVGMSAGGGLISACYSTGKLTSSQFVAGILSCKVSPVVQYSYYLEGTAEYGGCKLDDYSQAPMEQGQSFSYSPTKDYADMLSQLGEAYIADSDGSLTGGYPALAWQAADHTTASFAISDAITGDAITETTVTVDGTELEGSTVSLEAGLHKYTVKRVGYQTVESIFYLGRSNHEVQVSMQPVYYDYEIKVSPADADFTLTNDVFGTIKPEKKETGEDGCTYTFRLARSVLYGKYAYTAVKYGYGTVSGDVFITQQGSMEVKMTPSEYQTVNFEILPADAVLTVTDKDGNVIDPYDGKLYHLVEGSYQYEVRAKGYSTVNGTVTVPSSTTTISIVMEVKDGWDGTAETDWYQSGASTYYIETPEQFAGFRDLCNAGNNFSGKTIVLTADINLAERDWTPIAPYSYDGSTGFQGTLDGAGHKITGLKVSGRDEVGLFCYIYGGTVRNLTLAGTVEGRNYVGGFAGRATGGVFENCVAEVNVTVSGYQAGGVVGISSRKASTFTRCINNGAITSTDTAHTNVNSYAIGGILGNGSGSDVLEYCKNTGAVTAHTQSVGGLVGASSIVSGSAAPKLESCYNTGVITNTYDGGYTGGVIGNLYGSYNSGTVLRCLNLGLVSGANEAATGGIVGARTANSSNVGKCYYYYDTAEFGVGGREDVEDQAEAFGSETDNQFAWVVEQLGENYALDGDTIILKWENAKSKYLVTLGVSYDTSVNRLSSDKPVFTLRNDTEEFPVPSSGKVNLENGTYYYTAGQNGYDDATGSFVVANGDKTVTVRLTATRYDTVLRVTPKNASVTLKNSAGTVQEPVSSKDGEIHYGLLNGKYSYTLEAYGYEPKSGTIQVSYAKSETKLEMDKLADHEISFDLKPESGEFTEAPVLSIYQNKALVTKLSAAPYTATLAAGEYQYLARAKGFATASGSFKVEKSGSVEITISKTGSGELASDTAWYYENPDADSFSIGNAEELRGLAEIVNTGVDEFQNKTIQLTDDINMYNSAWTPIGKWDGGHFKGVFQGKGHSIVMTNGTISGTELAFGLFGYLDGATVSELTLRGSIDITHQSESTSSVIVYVGALAGYATGSTITRVANQLNVSVKADVGSAGVLDVGALAGWVNKTTLDNCSNISAVTAEITSKELGSNNTCLAYGGGIVGYGVSMSATPITLRNCYNTGAVRCTAPSLAQAAGLIGVVNSAGSSFRMENCYTTGKITANGSVGSALTSTANVSGTMVNNYYLNGSATSQVGYAKTEEEMKSEAVAEALGSAYAYVAGNYPQFTWEKTAGSIAIKTMPSKLIYNDLEDFDDTDMTLTVSYADGTSEEVSSGWTILNGSSLRVEDGEVDGSTATVQIQVEFKGTVTTLPVTVKQVLHIIDNDELALKIPAPKAGEEAKPLTIDTEKYTATVNWTQAGEPFTGVFAENEFYRAQVRVQAKYATGKIWYGFTGNSAITVDGAMEILYKNVKAEAANDNALTLLTAELTYGAVGSELSAKAQKSLHLYYAGDENADYSVDALLNRKITLSAGEKSVSYTLRELETRVLAGTGYAGDYCFYNGSYRTVTQLVGFPLYDLCAESGLFASNLSDDSVVKLGDREYTWQQIRTAGNSYDAEGKQTATDLPVMLAFGADGVPYTAAVGPMQAARPMLTAEDQNAADQVTKLERVSLDKPEYLKTHTLRLAVTTEDGADVTDNLQVTITDKYGHDIPATDGAYILNEGWVYQYSVGAKGYGTQKGSTEPVSGDTELRVKLVKTWDGETLTEPELSEDGYYLVYTAEELMWFNRNGTDTDNVRLMADITLNSDGEYVNQWKTMNTTETGGYFRGEFDGNGHTIYNLYISLENLYTLSIGYDGSVLLLSSRQDNAAMFGYLAGTVKDLGVTGRFEILDRPDSQLASWMQIGGIAGYVSGGGTISGCYTDIDVVYDIGKETTVTGGYPDCGFPEQCDVYIGGIAASVSKGTISNCYTTGSVTGGGTRKISVGGIVGGLRSKNAVVEYCYSTSDIHAVPTDMYSGTGMISGVGSIVGDAASYTGGEGGTVRYCFGLSENLDCGGSNRSSANRVVGTTEDSAVLAYNYGNKAMNINAGTHNDTDFSRSSVNGADIDLARAKANLTPYTNVGWSTKIWKSDSSNSLPSFFWQRATGETVTYGVEVKAADAKASFTGGVTEKDGNYFTTGDATISFTVAADPYRTVDTVTVTGGTLTAAGGYYTIREITGPVTITITTKVFLGDVNGDGKVNALDALLVLRYAAGMGSLSAAQLACGDVNGDGKVNSSDAMQILRQSVGAAD